MLVAGGAVVPEEVEVGIRRAVAPSVDTGYAAVGEDVVHHGFGAGCHAGAGAVEEGIVDDRPRGMRPIDADTPEAGNNVVVDVGAGRAAPSR